ncbi:hypothetical protein SAY87_030945 [Trapa incisa]|uniref:C2 domain-containing protein n=1 Tax=Trapa incisa TaxID=236973 RepID=A0AAN7KJR8_9MYRT|nr:hypothetical protein SAY87_030945 [Trapa incisa]
MSTLLNPIQLLELSIVSAQDLAPVTRSMHTYAVAWVHPDRRLTTRVDNSGRFNPSWNDKFVFQVDDEFLENDTSAVTVEIYAVHWLKDVKVGTVRVLIDNLVLSRAVPGTSRFSRHWQRQRSYVGMEFVALQVRRPSGRPQGMLNVGLAVLDGSMRSMPLSSCGIGFKGLLESPRGHRNHRNKQKKQTQEAAREAEFRRTKSDSSSMVSSSYSRGAVKRKVSFHDKASSLVDGSSTVSSLKPGSQVGLKAKRLDDAVGGLTFRRKGEGRLKRAAKKQGSSVKESHRKLHRDVCMTDSELGPSPSEVAAEMLNKRRNRSDDMESSVLGGAAYSVVESVEGLQSKLERWRAELPATMDAASDVRSNAPSVDKDDVDPGDRSHGRQKRSNGRRRRRRDGEGEGLFSCFSNICGCECSVTCRNPFKKRDGKPGPRRSRSRGSSTYV